MPKPIVSKQSVPVDQVPVVEQPPVVPPKKTKESKPKTPSTVVKEVPSVPAVESHSSVPVKTEKVSKQSKKQKEVEAPVSTEPVVIAKSVEHVSESVVPPKSSTEVVVPTSEFQVGTEHLVSKIKTLMSLCAELSRELKTLDKTHAKELKLLQKTGHKKRKNSGKPPSGFVKCATISDEMSDFLGKPSGTLMSRTDVTKAIHTYVKEQNLQLPENRRVILADDKLRELLKIPKEEIDANNFTYFKLQKYLKVHFPKPTVDVVAA